MLVHCGKDKTENWLLVRLDKDEKDRISRPLRFARNNADRNALNRRYKIGVWIYVARRDFVIGALV